MRNLPRVSWLKKTSDKEVVAYNEVGGPFDPAITTRAGLLYAISVHDDLQVWVSAWNRAIQRGDWWRHAKSPVNVWPPGKWAFLAATLRGGDVDRGVVQIRINDVKYDQPSQRADNPVQGHIMLGQDRSQYDAGCLVDEVAVFSRALSDAELDVLYRHVRSGQPLPAAGRLSSPTAAEASLRLPTWREQANLYRDGGRSFNLWDTKDGRTKTVTSPRRTIADWEHLGPEKNTSSIQGNTRYRGGDLAPRLAAEPETLLPADFRLATDSPGQGAGENEKDLGADVDLVGPGAEYERWKTTPDHQQWLKETGQTK